MFEVLAFVYDNYPDGDACPELPALHRSLNTFGFDPGEVQAALLWLEDLKSATSRLPACPTLQTTPVAGAAALRVLSPGEQTRLGPEGWGFLAFLVSIGSLPTLEFELVLERAMAASRNRLGLDDLKLIVLMVFWGLGREPEPLVLDELCDNQADRLAH